MNVSLLEFNFADLYFVTVSHIVNKKANFLELDKINKFKVIFDIHHRITAKFILRCYQLRKESLHRI